MNIRSLAPNQTEVELANHNYVFISYSTPVAAFVVGEGVWREDSSSSRTTAKHITRWINANFPSATVTKVPREDIKALLPD